MTKISKIAKTATALTVMSSLVTTAAVADTSQFSDIGGLNGESQQAIAYLQQHNIIHGVDPGEFNPSGSLTRAAFATIMVYTLGLPVNTSQTTSAYFSDVSGWAAGYVDAAKRAGLIDGVGDGNFDPNGVVTREQAAKILVSALKTKQKIDDTAPLTFTDVTDDWAKNYVALAEKYNLVKGVSPTQFAPLSNATREQAAVLAYRLIQTINANQNQDQTPTVTAVGFANANNTVTVYGKATNADSVKISVDGSGWLPVTLLANGTYSYTTPVLQQGTHSFSVEAISGTTASVPTRVNVIVGQDTTGDTPTVISIMTNPDISRVAVTDATHIQVYFTRPMDPTTASNKANYTVSNGVTVTSATLSSNNMTATLTLSAPFQNETYYTVVLHKEILDSSYNPLSTTTDFVTGILWNDQQAPTVQSILNWYGGSVKIIFTKPLGTIPTVVMNGTPVTVDGFVPGNNYVTISKSQLPTSVTTSNTYVPIIVENAKDQAVPANTMPLYQSTFRYYLYYQTPVVNSLVANGEKTLTLTFNEPLQGVLTNGSDNVGHAFNLTATETGGVAVNGITATTTDGQTFTLNLPDVYSSLNLSSATLTLTISNFSDPGNDLGAPTTRSVTVSEDRTAPYLVSENYTTDNKIMFNFNKPLSPIGASALASSLLITNSSSVPATLNSNEITQPSPNSIAIDNATLQLQPGTYTINFPKNAVKDTSINGNGNAQFTKSFTVPSTTSSTGTTVTVNADKQDVITVTYSAKVSKSATSLYNYLLNGANLPSTATLALDPSQQVVTITVPKNTIARTSTETLKIQNVTNLDNTYVPTTTQIVNVTDNTSPIISSANVDTTTGDLVVNFNEDVNGMADENPQAGGATTPLPADFILTVNGNVIDSSKVHVSPGASENQVKLTSATASFLTGTLSIQIAPTPIGADAAGNPITTNLTNTAYRVR